MAAVATYSVTNGLSLQMGSGSVAMDLTQHGFPVHCGKYLSFHAVLLSIGKASSSTSSSRSGKVTNKLVALVTVEALLSGARQGLLCKLKVEYNKHDSYYGGSTAGVWDPQPVPLTSVAKGSIISFALSPPSGLTSNDYFTATTVTLTVEPLNDHSDSATRPTPTEFQKARSESMLATINDPNLCDTSLLPAGTNGAAIRVSRAILAHASPYFKLMFNGAWAESAADKPIDFDWTVTAVLPCLMHMYSGWVLGDGLPDCNELKELLATQAVDTQNLTLHQLLELVDLAEMLELPLLVHATYEIMARRLGRKVKSSLVLANKLNQRAKVVEGAAAADKMSDVEE